MIPFFRVTSVQKDGRGDPRQVLLRADLVIYVEPLILEIPDQSHQGRTAIIFNNCDKPYEMFATEDFYTVQARIEASIRESYRFNFNGSVNNNVTQLNG